MCKAEGGEKYVVGEKDPPKGCRQLSQKIHGRASLSIVLQVFPADFAVTLNH